MRGISRPSALAVFVFMDQLEFGWQLDRQVRGRFAFENAPDVVALNAK
jgi:hypothetical protein